jgi:DNA-binding transcriptional MerR regulator
MDRPLTISAVARDTGIPARTIRFYEAEGILPPPARTNSGYRQYTPADVRRLALIKSARGLGLSVAEAGQFVDRALSADCAAFAPELHELIVNKRSHARQQIAELQRLIHEMDALELHVTHAECVATPGERVENCDFCVTSGGEKG